MVTHMSSLESTDLLHGVANMHALVQHWQTLKGDTRAKRPAASATPAPSPTQRRTVKVRRRVTLKTPTS